MQPAAPKRIMAATISGVEVFMGIVSSWFNGFGFHSTDSGFNLHVSDPDSAVTGYVWATAPPAMRAETIHPTAGGLIEKPEEAIEIVDVDPF